MGKKIEAYVDTSALIAFADRSDTHHSLFLRLFAKPPTLITSPMVVAEGHAWFLRRYDRTKALQFLAMIESMQMKVFPVGFDEQTEAAKVLRKFNDQDLTLVDAVGLHIMHARKIGICWSTDFHLSLTGVPLVIDEH